MDIIKHQIILLVVLAISAGSDNCDCDTDGTIGALSTCNGLTRSCNCKPSVVRQTNCQFCYPQFFNLTQINVFGCQRCSCDLGGSLSRVCNDVTGECRCKEGIAGRDCDRPAGGTYVPALYHINSNLVIGDSITGLNLKEGSAKINGVIEPKDIPNLPPRFQLLFDEYPVPISFEDIEAETLKSKEAKKRRKLRSVPDTLPIVEQKVHSISKRQVSVMYVTEIEFPRPGTYFLVLNYTTSHDTNVMVDIGDTRIPALLPKGAECLIMLAGSLGVKGVQVSRAGTKVLKIAAPRSVSIHYTVALPKEYYFTASLKQDVSPRCNPGPFTQLCNRYHYPSTGPEQHVEEAEAWLSPVSQPAYTKLSGVNLFGKETSDDSNRSGSKATNKLKMVVELSRGVYYYIVVHYYKPYHYRFFSDPTSARFTFGNSQTGELDFPPCPWEEGCKVVVTSTQRKRQLFEAAQDSVNVVLKVEDHSVVFIDSLMFVREEEWTLDLIQAQWYCVKGPNGACLQADFIDLTDHVFYESESAIDAVKIVLEDTFHHGTGVLQLAPAAPSLSVVLLENTINLPTSELYVVVVHYFKYTPRVARGSVLVQDSNRSQAELLYTFCPGASGCRVAATVPGRVERGAVSHNPSWEGQWSSVPVTGGNNLIIVTLSLAQQDSVYVDYLALVPLAAFNVDMLYPLPLDHGPLFTQYCAYHYLYLNPKPELEAYCKSVVFTMTTMYHNGTLECECSEPGSVSEVCDRLSGQCQCRPGFGGRACGACLDGYYGYPACTACECDAANSYSDTCDQESGQCKCEQNFSGRRCDACNPGSYGNDNGVLTCDRSCDCDVQGATDVTCHPSTGQCSCTARSGGLKCDSCLPGHYRYPACYACQCHQPGSLLEQGCDLKGICTCKTGYAGVKCEECDSTHYYNGSSCAPCECSGVDVPCSGLQLYHHQIVDDFSSGQAGYTLVDTSGSPSPSSRLTTLVYDNEPHVLMVDLSPNDQFTFLSLPDTFRSRGMRVGEGDLFRYQVFLITPGGRVLISAETFFQGNTQTLVYKYRTEHVTNKPKRAKVQVDIEVEVPLISSTEWSVVGTGEQPTTELIREVFRDLQDIKIGAKMFDGQLVAMVNQIQFTFLSPTSSPTSAPLYTRECDCGVAYSGTSCQNCSTSYYRAQDTGLCDEPCSCSGNSLTCDEEGVCRDCDNHSEGPHCEHCEAGYYKTSRGTCEPCWCTGNMDSRVYNTNQTCEEREGARVCTRCEEGYSGNNCRGCDNGYYSATEDGVCIECPCNGNLNLTVPAACNPRNGRCNVCINSTTGGSCQRCASGYYGNAREGTCRPCGCHAEGAVSEDCGDGGTCRCKHRDITGDKCDTCPEGQYVLAGRCVPCECHQQSSLSEVCSPGSGQCPCVPGYGARDCGGCEAAFYPKSGNCLECGCSERGSPHPQCDGDGVCTCRPGYYGRKCTECTGTHAVDQLGACTVCGKCPLLLLEQMKGINATMDQSKTDTLLADYADKLNKLQARAEDVTPAAPQDITDLMDLLEETRAAAQDNAGRADALVPRSQEDFADVEDLGRSVRDVPGDVGQLQDTIRDITDLVDNFNLGPDAQDRDEDIEKAGDLLEEMKNRDLEAPLKRGKNTKAAAQRAKDKADAKTPEDPTIPSLAPLPARVTFLKDQVAVEAAILTDVSRDLDKIAPRVSGVELMETAAEELEGEVEGGVTNVTSQLPAITKNNQLAQNGLDAMESPELQPLEELVEAQEEALRELTPLVKPREFNCSGISDFKNVSSDDPGPKLIKDMLETETNLAELRRRVAEAEEAAANATAQAESLEGEVASRALADSDMELKMGDVIPKLNDLVSQEPQSRDALTDLADANKADRERLEGLDIPAVPEIDPAEVPESVVAVPDLEPLQQRIESIEPKPEIVELRDEVPRLLEDTDTAEGKKNTVVEESRSIEYRLRSLKDKIERAKQLTESIIIPMIFEGDDSYARYDKSVERSGYLSIKAKVRPVEDGETGGIVKFGSGMGAGGSVVKRQAGSDYVEIGLDGGHVTCTVSIDNAILTLKNSDNPVPKDSWTDIHLLRIGKHISLAVGGSVKRAVGDPGLSSSFNADTLLIGKTSHGSFQGGIFDVFVNGERIPLWLTDDKKAKTRVDFTNQIWATYKMRDEAETYHCNGDSSYIAFVTYTLDDDYIRSISAEISTASEDGMIMFYGEGSVQEGTAEVFAVDLYKGDVRLHYTDHLRQLQTLALSPADNSTFADAKSKNLIATIEIYDSSAEITSASLRLRLGKSEVKLQVPQFLPFTPKDFFEPGTSYMGLVPPHVKDRFPGFFGGAGIALTPFAGCLSNLNLNTEEVISSAIVTARNINTGCPGDRVKRVMTLEDRGRFAVSHDLTNLEDLSFSLATASTSGNIILISNSADEYLSVSLEEGKVLVKLQVGGVPVEIRSNAVIGTRNKRYVRIALSDRISLHVDDIVEVLAMLSRPLFVPSRSTKIVLGRVRQSDNGRVGPSAGYTGCLSDLIINDKIFDFLSDDGGDSSNVLLDRCWVPEVPDPSWLERSTPSDSSTITPTPTASYTEGPANLEVETPLPVSTRACETFSTSLAPHSHFISSTKNSLSYLKIPNTNSISFKLNLQLNVSSVSPGGVIVYVASRQDHYILVTFNEYSVVMETSIVTGRQPTSLTKLVRINDGASHKIEVDRTGPHVKLYVDGKGVFGTIKGGTTMFMLSNSGEEDSCSNGFCLGNSPVPLPNTQNAGAEAGSFVGCITGVYLQGLPAELSAVGAVSRCTQDTTLSSSHYFNGDSSIVPDVSLSDTDEVSVVFRSNRQTGLLLAVLTSTNTTLLKVTLDNNKVLAWTTEETVQVMPSPENNAETADNLYFCNVDQAHTLYLRLQESSAVISVDGGRGVAVTLPASGDVTLLQIGDQFLGCMEDPKINGVPIPLSRPLLNTGVLQNSCPSQTF